MSAEGHSQNLSVVTTELQDPAADKAHAHEEQPHDHATEVAHAWDHFQGKLERLLCLLFHPSSSSPSSRPTSISARRGNLIAIFFFAAARSALIAYFMLTLFKSFSFVTRTFVFSALFLAGMIFLSWWDSELGDPIKDRINPPSQSHVP